jgi:hypothetical protein
MPRSRLLLAASLSVLLGALAHPSSARADDPGDASLVEARQEFLRGNELAKGTQWAEALAAFERSAAKRPHPMTTYNIGICERVLGRTTRARQRFASALAEGAADPAALPPSLAEEMRGFVAEIERTLARVRVTIAPADAGIAIDGRPLAPGEIEGHTALIAGILPPAIGSPPASADFELVLDPGTHVFTLSRKGYADIVLTRTFAPASRGALALELERLPATMHIGSNVPQAIVRVSDHDVGVAPVDVSRPAGAYHVQVARDGYVPYEADVALRPGEEANLRATLVPEKVPITKQWWFWTGAVVVVAGGVGLTYALTRPDPQPPPFDGGSSGWVATPKGFAW